ncbi:SDR family NAD(P)-dependent oxidoreductase [Agrobacterium larrymoorei]|uniref:SDR family oxidoreductase n=1 Tax=Agrobacterium larrymoorei TaxID=160699 RepID=UPI0015716F45|nr:SDR family oxidoreductase [Agrobacterium larrymoorei]NTJ43802.1 SDR family NAD(P)-dependent oxidoreductase [Agrobacterium larrymoorei]
MSLENKVILITGASRGIGAATVKAALAAGAAKVYASARNLASLPDFGDARVVPLQLDVTDETSVSNAAVAAKDVDVLINNAGTMTASNFLNTPVDAVEADMNTNYYGTLRVIRAFFPQFKAKGNGVVVNVASIVGLAPIPPAGSYSASKAALHSLTQSLRTSLSQSGIKVLGVYPGPIDTDLAKDLQMQKASPEEAAANIINGIVEEQSYIFPDPVSSQLGGLWASNPKAAEAAILSGG